jgi:hypothetical protein
MPNNPRAALAPTLANKLCRCIKSVRKTVKLRKGQPKTSDSYEKAAIGICVKSVIQGKSQKRTLRRFTCRNRTPMLITQKPKRANIPD